MDGAGIQDGALWTYAATANVTFRGLESATNYAFAAKNTLHGLVPSAAARACLMFIDGR